MSGTSLDGADVACCRFAPAFSMLGQHHVAMPPRLRDLLQELQAPTSDELHKSMLAGLQLATLYAQACHELLDKLGINAASIAAIGCHGQTIRHRPADGYSLQLNQPARLAELTGIDIIADFRSRDIAAGGQGAPLVPGFHAWLFQSPDKHRVLLNLGGMANLTNLPVNKEITGFDCGPGNVLLDAWCEHHLGKTFDAEGAWGASGRSDPQLLQQLLAHPFLAKKPPKSCGREEFNLHALNRLLPTGIAAVDVQATLLNFTAHSAAQAILQHCAGAEELILCGGGACNTALRERLQETLPALAIYDSSALGLPVDAVEAAAFAWLAWRFQLEQPGNLPAVTGARGLRRLGALYTA